MDIQSKIDLLILSGEGTGPGTYRRYYGKRTHRAIEAALTREKCSGDRWAQLWAECPELCDTSYPDSRVYTEIHEIGNRYERGDDIRVIAAEDIRTDPVREAAKILGGKKTLHKSRSSARNGRSPGTGRPRKKIEKSA